MQVDIAEIPTSAAVPNMIVIAVDKVAGAVKVRVGSDETVTKKSDCAIVVGFAGWNDGDEMCLWRNSHGCSCQTKDDERVDCLYSREVV